MWGGGILLVGLINLVRPEYGTTFLTMMTSVYPWFHAAHTGASVMVGAVDGLIDGAIAGCLFGWLYNAMLDMSSKAQPLRGQHT